MVRMHEAVEGQFKTVMMICSTSSIDTLKVQWANILRRIGPDGK